MPHHNLQDLNLNLLLSLDALLTERSVTRAAQSCHVTQPAMSQTLARLRTVFDDPLLVRAGRGMEPTALAARMADTLHALLSQMDALVGDQGEFQPAHSSHAFALASLDHFSVLHLPKLTQQLQVRAPQLRLNTLQLSYDKLPDQLERGEVDLGVGVFHDAPAGLMQRALHCEQFMCVLRTGHPMLDDWNIESFVGAKHGLLSTTGRGVGIIDHFLAHHNQSRSIHLRIPHFLAVGAVVEASDLIFTVAGRLAAWFQQHHGVVCIAPPLELPQFTVSMRWHEHRHQDPAHAWLRAQLAESAHP